MHKEGFLTRFSFCGRQLEMGDGAQGRKHIDLLGGSYAQETCKARKAWTPRFLPCVYGTIYKGERI